MIVAIWMESSLNDLNLIYKCKTCFTTMIMKLKPWENHSKSHIVCVILFLPFIFVFFSIFLAVCFSNFYMQISHMHRFTNTLVKKLWLFKRNRRETSSNVFVRSVALKANWNIGWLKDLLSMNFGRWWFIVIVCIVLCVKLPPQSFSLKIVRAYMKYIEINHHMHNENNQDNNNNNHHDDDIGRADERTDTHTYAIMPLLLPFAHTYDNIKGQ